MQIGTRASRGADLGRALRVMRRRRKWGRFNSALALTRLLVEKQRRIEWLEEEIAYLRGRIEERATQMAHDWRLTADVVRDTMVPSLGPTGVAVGVNALRQQLADALRENAIYKARADGTFEQALRDEVRQLTAQLAECRLALYEDK